MNASDLGKYRKLLIQLRSKILSGGIVSSNADLVIGPEDMADEGDLATSIVNQEVSFSIRQRELNKLRAIEEALLRIEDGTYGHCEECDEEIKAKRLELQPWTTLCVGHAE